MKLLDVRIFELTNRVHRSLEHVWEVLVRVDAENGSITILKSHPDESMSLADTLKGVESYHETKKRMIQFWNDVDRAVIKPRMDAHKPYARTFDIDESTSTISLQKETEETENSAQLLLKDLEALFRYLSMCFPDNIIGQLSEVMMEDLSSRIVKEWLDRAVPPSLTNMDEFDATVAATKHFAQILQGLSYSGFSELETWADSAPKVWLTKCRETALDSVRSKLANGLWSQREVERVEKYKVTRSEGRELAAASGGQDGKAWDAVWSDDAEESEARKSEITLPITTSQKGQGLPIPDDDGDGADAWGWGDNDAGVEAKAESSWPETTKKAEEPQMDDDDGDAWGWGDDGEVEPEIEIEQHKPTSDARPPPPSVPSATCKAIPKSNLSAGPPLSPSELETREITLKETYSISNMPDPILTIITSLLTDGAALLADLQNSKNQAVEPAASGIFSLPTLVLAMFRAIAPYYYALSQGGNMFLYNDSRYLATQLSELVQEWKDEEHRPDLSPRARAMLRLDSDIETLNLFAARTYGNELATQKTVVRDLLGGSAQSFLFDQCGVGAAVAHIRYTATKVWEDILAPSVWYQAVGQLVDEAARKMVADVLDMPSIGQDDAYSIASMIEMLADLDDLFLPQQIQKIREVSRNRPPKKQDLEAEDSWGWGDEDDCEHHQKSQKQQQNAGSEKTEDKGDGRDSIPTTAQFAPTWLRLKYLSQFLQSNLNEVRYMWFESELSLHFSAHEVVDLLELSFEQNSRTKTVMREIREKPFPRRGESE